MPLRLVIPVARQPRLAEARHGNFVSIVPVVVQRQHATPDLAKAIQRIGALDVRVIQCETSVWIRVDHCW